MCTFTLSRFFFLKIRAMKTVHLLPYLLLISFSTFAQLENQPEQDCINAIHLCDPVYVQPNSYQGVGMIEDLQPFLSCLENEENNSVWYTFEIADSGMLEFTITSFGGPDDTVDYD